MGVLIDASILIEHERGRLDLEHHLSERADEGFLSVITASELLHGVHRARDTGMRVRRSAWIESILARFDLVPIDATIARTHARLWAELDSRGTPIGPHDLWLAATGLVHGLTVVTANVREFKRVPGLAVDSWTDPPHPR